ncbi:hypothetical protein JCM3765_005605 [Sporobolomyces pararoseus]
MSPPASETGNQKSGHPSPISLPSRITGLATDSHLRGVDNYPIWAIQMESIVGMEAFEVMTGNWKLGDGHCTDSEWKALDSHARQCIIISCTQEVIKQVSFSPDAQGHLRLLQGFWNHTLHHASPEAFQSFELEYKSMIAQIRSSKIDIELILSSHLLSSLPPALSSFQTSINVLNAQDLPSVDSLLELLRNEIARSTSTSSTALVAQGPPPPYPYPACQANHWLRDCAKGEEWKKNNPRKNRRKPSANIATSTESTSATSTSAPTALLSDLLELEGVEAWLASQIKISGGGVVIVDTGATHSMVGDKKKFTNLQLCTPSAVGGLTSTSLKVLGVGSVTLRLANGRLVSVNKVLYVPGISHNLLSASQLFDLHNVTSTFGEGATLSRNGQVLATGTRLKNNLYKLDGTLVNPSSPSGASALLATSSTSKLTTLHRRFAHLSLRALKSLAKSDDIVGLEVDDKEVGEVCNVCHVSRATRLPFPSSDRQSSHPLELVHSDVLSINVPSLGGAHYVVTFVDDFSRMLWVEPLARKSDVFAAFKRFQAKVENDSDTRIKRFRSDNGGEYISTAFKDHLLEHGILHETPPPYSPQSNGVAERVNRTIVEGLLSLLNQSGAPRELWAEALQAFVFVKNRSPHRALDGRVPLAVWRRRAVKVDMLRVWGCRAYHTVTEGRKKLDNKAIPLVLVGYDGDTNAYRLYNPLTKSVIRSRDARFDESTFPLLESTPLSHHFHPSMIEINQPPRLVAPQPAPAPPSTPLRQGAPPPTTPKPVRVRSVDIAPPPQPVFVREQAPPPSTPDAKPPLSPIPESPDPLDFLSDPFEALIAAADEHLESSNDQFSLPTSDPRNHKEAMLDTDNASWRAGEEEEFESLKEKYKVFNIVKKSQVPPGAKILGCRFVYRRKKDQFGKVKSHKVRLVAQGFAQRPGLDFRETFAPVAKFTSIRVLLALAARQGLKLQQADVDKAYLYGKLEEELYMRVPEGIEGGEYAGKVLKLERSLYGLKQAGRVWNHRIHGSLSNLGYKRTTSDACVYVRNEGGIYHYIALYVDDLLFVSPNQEEIDRVKEGLRKEYGIKDLGDAEFILGIQIHRRADGSIFLSQKAYLEDVLLRLGHSDCRPAKTPMVPNLQLVPSPNDYTASPEDRRHYLQAVGSLMYAMLSTRPNIAHAVGVLGRHSANPGPLHWAAVVHVLRYLKGTLDFGLKFNPDNSPLVGFEAYSDSDWGACPTTSRSTMGYAFILSNGAVSWSSKLQPRVAGSSSEAEYISLSHSSKESVFLSQLLIELGIPLSLPTTLFGDNQGANALSRDPQFHNRTRHLRLNEHFVREQVQQGFIDVKYIPTGQMVADVMTKSLPAPSFLLHRSSLGVRPFRARGGVAADALRD